MKLENIHLHKEPDRSFIFYHEKSEFSHWHYHREYELVLIVNGTGKRMVGDHISRFDTNDLVLTGPNLPHEWLCDQQFYTSEGTFTGEGLVIQFVNDFLGRDFFNIHENRVLRKLLDESVRGLIFKGDTKKKIIRLMMGMQHETPTDKLYSLLRIFHILSKDCDYTLLCSPNFMEPFHGNGNQPMQKALEFILKNFQDTISVKHMLEITRMSNSAFCSNFKKTYRMSFKEYLLKTRIGYACKLLVNNDLNISEIAYQSGFENLANFNRQFRSKKGVTPSEFRLHAEKSNTVG